MKHQIWLLFSLTLAAPSRLICAGADAAAVTVYAVMPDEAAQTLADISVARKQQHDLRQRGWNVEFLSAQQQRSFLESHCGSAVAVYDAWGGSDPDMSDLQSELFKWCALLTSPADTAIFLDSSSPILSLPAEMSLVGRRGKNIAVLDDEKKIIHGSFIQITNGNRSVAQKMLQILLDTDADLLRAHALFVPQTLYNLIQQQKSSSSGSGEDWGFWHVKCRRRPVKHQLESSSTSGGHPHVCPVETGYCCAIQDRTASVTVMMSRSYILPLQNIPRNQQLANPFNGAGDDDDDDDDDDLFVMDRPFVSTVTVKEIPKTNNVEETPNFYDILKGQDCLPDDDDCSKCLREKKGANCQSCAGQCSCYCEKLCATNIPTKHVAQEWTVTPPHYAKDPTRLVPRIVHQTWFEELDAEKYPNMSRLVESFKQAGWDYRFYSDDDAVVFLQTHFPPAVLEAYQALKPGAFKADLFRYCVLLITGGVYADVDIQLESALDVSIPPDVGFMVPVDEPGKPVNKQMCLWNGFIAAAPAHPILAKAIETVVNQVRNRFTSVDVDATFCPNPELSVLHAYDTLFTAGPCLLGSSLNRVLGRNGQKSHVPGELKALWSGEQRELTKQGTSFVLGVDEEGGFPLEHRIPGRTVILHQNKWDMGAHRFTFLEQNLVVAATDLPDSNDRVHLEEGGATEHYSKTHAKTGIYGVEHLYVDRESANEDIRILIDASMHAKKQTNAVAE